MRIIRGKFKNKRLFFPKNLKTRPLKNSVRENIFNILEHSKKIDIKIENSKVLDLYSGCGSFGLESLSRNAAEVSFVERDIDALKSLKKNIKNLKVKDEIFIFEKDVFNFIHHFNLKKRFNIIFMDPPYSDKKFIDIFDLFLEREVFNRNCVVIVHRETNSLNKLDFKNLNIIENRVYGRSEIFFYKIF